MSQQWDNQMTSEKVTGASAIPPSLLIAHTVRGWKLSAICNFLLHWHQCAAWTKIVQKKGVPLMNNTLHVIQ